MSAHKPFTRGGRRLELVRPRPFVPPPVPVLLWRLVRRPAAGVDLVLRSQVPPGRLAVGLIAAGAAQALVTSLFRRGGEWNSYFLLHTISWLLATWLASALITGAAGRLLGQGAVSLRPALAVTGIATYASVVLASLLPVPLIAHAVYSAWLAAVCWQMARRVYRVRPWWAALTAILTALAVLWLLGHE